MEGVHDFLKTVSLFQDLDKRHRATIAKTIFERTCEPGEAIVREGETGVGAFMIRSGKVEVTKESGSEAEHLNTLGPGDVFWEIALLTDMPRRVAEIARPRVPDAADHRPPPGRGGCRS